MPVINGRTMAPISRRPMTENETTDIMREELDELHERLAVLTDRVDGLERDRDVLLAAVETQSELNEEAAVRHERLVHLFEEARAKANAHDRSGAGHPQGTARPVHERS